MAKRWSNQAAKTINAITVETYIWTPDQVSQASQRYLINETTGANNDLTAIDELLVKSERYGLLWDILTAQLRAFAESETPNNLIPSTSALYWGWPLGAPGGAPGSGIPFGAVGTPIDAGISYEVVSNNTNAAGSIRIGGEENEGKPAYYSQFVTQQSGIGANVSLGRINLNKPNGLLYGISLPLVGATGLLNLRVVVADKEVVQWTDQQALIQMAQQVNPATVITTLFLRMPELRPATLGNSYIEIQTGAGAAVTDAYAPFYLIPHP